MRGCLFIMFDIIFNHELYMSERHSRADLTTFMDLYFDLILFVSIHKNVNTFRQLFDFF